MSKVWCKDRDAQGRRRRRRQSPRLFLSVEPKGASADNERAFQSAKEHREILDAILAGNGSLAEELTVQHVKNAAKNMKKAIKG